jgi:hypothetical protein
MLISISASTVCARMSAPKTTAATVSTASGSTPKAETHNGFLSGGQGLTAGFGVETTGVVKKTGTKVIGDNLDTTSNNCPPDTLAYKLVTGICKPQMHPQLSCNAKANLWPNAQHMHGFANPLYIKLHWETL